MPHENDQPLVTTGQPVGGVDRTTDPPTFHVLDVDSEGRLITASSSGGESNVNLTEINGAPVGINNPLYVETTGVGIQPTEDASDGTIGNAIPLVAGLSGAENPSGDLEPLQVNAQGALIVSATVGAPTGTQTVIVSGTSTVIVSGGTVDIAGTSTVTVAGSVTVAATGTQTVTIAGSVGISGTPTVEVAGIVGTSTVTVAGVTEVSPTSAANTRVNPFFNEITDGTNVMGTMVAFGSNPGTALALNVNAAIQQGTVALAGTSTVTVAGTITVAATGTQTVAVVGTSTVEVAGIAGTPTVEVAGILGTSTVTVAGAVTVAATGTQTVTVAGSIGISGTPTVEVAGILGGTVALAGTSTVIVSGGTVDIAGTSTVTVAGTVTVVATGTQTVVVSGIVGTSTVEVAGIVGTSTVTIAGVSTVNVQGHAGSTLDSTVVPGTAPTNGLAVLGQYNTTPPTCTASQTVALQVNAQGALIVQASVAPATGTQTTVIVGTSTVEVAGIVGTSTVTIAGSVTLAETPTVAISGTATVEVAGILGTSTVQVAGISAGTVAIAGTSTVTVAGGTVDVAGTSTVAVVGTSTVEVAGIVGTSTVAVAGSVTVDVTGQIAGPVAAGTAASSSVLTGSVYNTAAPSLTNTQQAARQADSAGNLRINPYGNVGSFKNASVTTTITASATLQVAAATKWLSRSIRFTAQPSNTVTKQANIWITDASGNVMWETNGPVFTPTNTLVYETLLYPSGYVSTGTTVAAGYIASARGTSTQVITLGMPEMHLGPSFQINAMLNGAAGTATYTLSVNVLQLSD